MKPTVRVSLPSVPGSALTSLLGVAALAGIALPVAVALQFSPLWWISAFTTIVLTISGLLLARIAEERTTARLLLATAATANLVELVFWQGPTNYWGELGFLAQWVPVPLLALAMLTYPGGTVDARARRFYRAAWVWALGPRLVSALSTETHPGGAWGDPWIGLANAPAVGAAALHVEAVTSIGLAAWASVLFRRRWRGSRGTAARLTRTTAVAGTVIAWGVVAREAGRVLFDAGLIERGTWDRIGDAHQLVIVASVVLVGYNVVWSFARRGKVAERMVGTAGDPVGLREVLRDELHDPTVELYFRVEDAWLSVEGAKLDPPTDPDRDVVEVAEAGGRPKVLVALDPADRLDPVRRRVALAASGLVLSAASVALERDAFVAEVAASRSRIAAAAEAQRRQFERMLHDGIQQALLAATATLSRAKLAGRAGDATAVGTSIDQAHTQLLDALAELRRLARGIYPSALAESGLLGGLQALVQRWPGVTLTAAPPTAGYADLAEDRASLIYFAVAEGLANAHKYGRPPVAIALRQDDATVTGEVVDGGPGGAVRQPGGGLAGLDDRVRGLGGTLRLTSLPGSPTRLVVTLPRR